MIRLGFEPKTHSLEGCCSIQLSYRTDPYVFPVRWNALQWKVGAKVVKIFGIARVEINTLLFICGEPVKCDGVEIRGGAGGYVLAIWYGAPSQIEGVSLAGGVDEGDCLPVGLQRESMEVGGEMVAFVGAEVDERASGTLEANALTAEKFDSQPLLPGPFDLCSFGLCPVGIGCFTQNIYWHFCRLPECAVEFVPCRLIDAGCK